MYEILLAVCMIHELNNVSIIIGAANVELMKLNFHLVSIFNYGIQSCIYTSRVDNACTC